MIPAIGSQAAVLASYSSASTLTLGQWLPGIVPTASLEQLGAVSLALADRLAPASGFSAELLGRLRSGDIPTRGWALVELRDGESHQRYLTPLRDLSVSELEKEVAATFEVSRPIPTNRKPATLAGRYAGSILGYALYRLLTGLGNALIGRGWLWEKTASQRAYEPNPERMRGRVRFRHTPAPALTTSETASKHTQAFATEIEWAKALREDRLALHSETGRAALAEAERRMLGLRHWWRELCNDSVREILENPFTTGSTEEFAKGHAATADARLRRNETMLRLILEGEKIEHALQSVSYADLIGIARQRGAQPKKLAVLEAALQEYREAALAYEGLLEKGLQYDPDVRGDYKVKKGEQATFMALWALHNLTRQVFERVRHPDANALRAPLTFSARNQAYLLDGVGEGQAGLEPLFEAVRFTRPITQEAKRQINKLEKKGALTPEARRVAVDTMEDGAIHAFGLPQILAHFRSLTIAAPEGYQLFADRKPELAELALIEGGLAMLATEGPETVEHQGGSITNAPHMSATDYAMQIALPYLLGDERISIVAEEAFRKLPVFRHYIGLGGGVFISRSEVKALKDKMKGDITDRIEQLHRSVVIYGTGTRLLGDVLGNPHADLTNPAVLYIPGESSLSRFTTGQSAAEAVRNKVPLKVVSQNLKRGGAIEPSIPRGRKGFTQRNQTMFGHVRPGMGPAFAAIAGVIPHEALLVSTAEGHDAKFEALKRDAALVREMEMHAAFGLDIDL